MRFLDIFEFSLKINPDATTKINRQATSKFHARPVCYEILGFWIVDCSIQKSNIPMIHGTSVYGTQIL